MYQKDEDSIAEALSITHSETRTGSVSELRRSFKRQISNDQQARLHGLTDSNVAQLPEQSRHSFSIPTADVEEPTAVLSGSGISINQRAHLRDINSCMSALLCASNIGLNRAMERLVLERDRVLLNLEESSSVPGEMTVLEIQDSMAESE